MNRSARNKRNQTGRRGEKLAAQWFRQNGYRVEWPKESHCGDLHVLDGQSRIRVEVKTVHRGNYSRKWQATLMKPGSQDHRHSDYVLLLAIGTDNEPVPFLIPTEVIADKKRLVLCSEPATCGDVYRSTGRMRRS